MKIYNGECLKTLKQMQSESVDCVMTSPPYYGLRDYGVKGQIGMEKTPEEFIQNLVSIFDEVKRVLKKSGTCFVNIGDSYGGSGKGYGDKKKDPKYIGRSRTLKPDRSAAKSLMQIPSRFAIAMTDHGWTLRNEIIWHKPNAMPQSVRDRFTVDFEKLFFFTKSRKYFFEQQYESLSASTLKDHRLFNKDFTQRRRQRNYPGQAQQGSGMLKPHSKGRNMRTVWKIGTQPFKDAHFAVYPEELCRIPIRAGSPRGGVEC